MEVFWDGVILFGKISVLFLPFPSVIFLIVFLSYRKTDNVREDELVQLEGFVSKLNYNRDYGVYTSLILKVENKPYNFYFESIPQGKVDWKSLKTREKVYVKCLASYKKKKRIRAYDIRTQNKSILRFDDRIRKDHEFLEYYLFLILLLFVAVVVVLPLIGLFCDECG